MKYIIWEFISPYDGYDRNEYETWEKVCEVVLERTSYHKQGKTLYKNWLSGKTPVIHSIDNTEILFVTSEPITKAL